MRFTRQLFKKYTDKRGTLSEFLKPSELSSEKFIQFFCATINPGKKRGNHYHRQKNESILLVCGKVKVVVEDIFTKRRREFILDASQTRLSKITISNNFAHTVTNISKIKAVIIGYLTQAAGAKNINRWEYKRYALK